MQSYRFSNVTSVSLPSGLSSISGYPGRVKFNERSSSFASWLLMATLSVLSTRFFCSASVKTVLSTSFFLLANSQKLANDLKSSGDSLSRSKIFIFLPRIRSHRTGERGRSINLSSLILLAMIIPANLQTSYTFYTSSLGILTTLIGEGNRVLSSVVCLQML